MGAEELAIILGKTDKKHLVRTILNPMINDGKLEYAHPYMVNHPHQKYKTKTKNN